MLVIYTQDETYVIDNNKSKDLLNKVYGTKIGNEAYINLKDAPKVKTFRKNGGPLIKVVNKDEANMIIAKEKEIGMYRG